MNSGEREAKFPKYNQLVYQVVYITMFTELIYHLLNIFESFSKLKYEVKRIKY